MANKLSRAKWIGEWYRRKRTGDWRNGRTGAISSRPNGKKIATEYTHHNYYDGDRYIKSVKKPKNPYERYVFSKLKREK